MLLITQNSVEIVRQPSEAEVRVTACAQEVLRSTVSRYARATQMTIEILRTNAAPPSETSLQPIIIVAG